VKGLIELRTGGEAGIARDTSAAADTYTMPMVAGHLPADTWTEISDVTEGRFRERVTQEAFAKALKRDREQIRILFQHGHDMRFGSLPIAPLEIAFVDVRGLVWGGRLFGNSIGRDLAPVLASGVLGASFRFQVLDEELERYARASRENVEALPSRTVRDLRLFELGPVVFPAYTTSSAGTSAPAAPRSRPRRFTSDAEWNRYVTGKLGR
jgi:HK97 family phage prohead protease